MMASIKDRILLSLGGLFLIILLGLLIFDITRRGIYSSKMGINIVVVGDSGVSVLMLRPEEEMVGWVKLPSSIRIKIFNSEARYPLSSVWSFGNSERNVYEIMEKSLGQSMGVLISKTIKLDDNSAIENVLGKLFQISLKTNLSIRDRGLIRKFLADSLYSKQVLELSIPSTVFDKVIDPDGKEFFEFNQAMSLWTKNKFVLEPILNENADVSINNISGVSGKGSVLANQLESSGMHLIELKADTEEQVTGKGCLYFSNANFDMTEQLLNEQVDCREIAKPSFVGDDEKIRIWIL